MKSPDCTEFNIGPYGVFKCDMILNLMSRCCVTLPDNFSFQKTSFTSILNDFLFLALYK